MNLLEMNKKFNIYAAVCVAALAGLTLSGCATDALEDSEVPHDMEQAMTIVAYIDQPATTRACITSDLEGQTQVPVLWSPSDVLGVFTASDNNVQYANSNLLNNTEVATFKASASVTGNPVCAYYPYSALAGTDKTALKGEIPQTQKMNLVTGMIPGDYKIGVHASTTSSGSQFRFTHLFSPIRVKFDGTGTALANDRLIGIDLTVTRSGAAVPVSGSFTFNGTDGSYTVGNTSNKVTFDWPTHPVMNVANHGYATIFPEIKAGDNLDFTIRTSAHTATLSVTAKVDFKPNTVYTFPLTFSNYSSNMTVTERTDAANGTFTCATYNIKGSTDATIGTKITEDQWDILMFCECGSGYSTNMSGYSFGSKSSTMGDLLYFGTRTVKCSLSNEYTETYDEEYGIDNTLIAKGFRYYLVTLSDGVEIDVYITHMNSGSEVSHIAAQHSQLQQVATYIANHRNGRPVIFMGDTNCRYTRHDFEKYFWSVIREAGLTINDPWADYMWNGVYPEYGYPYSLVVEDADNTNAETDIIYSSQKGEVVDKVIYFNDPDADVQISATVYLRDTDYLGLSDHLPVVIEFYYEKTATASASTQLEVYEWEDETIE